MTINYNKKIIYQTLMSLFQTMKSLINVKKAMEVVKKNYIKEPSIIRKLINL